MNRGTIGRRLSLGPSFRLGLRSGRHHRLLIVAADARDKWIGHADAMGYPARGQAMT